MSRRLDGKTALVTGASRGIGYAVAERLIGGGARVVITGRTARDLDAAVISLGGSTVAMGVVGKADDAEHRAAAVRRTIETFGGLDLLVNNTGINPTYGPMIDLDLGVARKVVEVNCWAALGWIQEAYRAAMAEHGGSIVNISSVSGVRPAPGIGMYGASKAMLISMTELLAVELSPAIRVNAVAPAVVKTRFATALYENREPEVAAEYPLQRLGEPEDIGSVVAFLLSEDASWITGQTVVVDGGITLAGAGAEL